MKEVWMLFQIGRGIDRVTNLSAFELLASFASQLDGELSNGLENLVRGNPPRL